MRYFKNFLLLTLLVLTLFVSCDSKITATTKNEGGVNYFIYPYLRFEISEDSSYASAIVIEGAKVTHLNIPGTIQYKNKALQVKEFLGFENSSDASSLKTLKVHNNISVIKLENTEALEKLEIVQSKENQTWTNLPELTKKGYHFLGWKAGDNFVHEGDAINPLFDSVSPIFERHALIKCDGHDASCTEEGALEHYECSICHKKYLDSNGNVEVSEEALVIKATGHTLTFYEGKDATCFETGTIAHYHCSVCDLYFTDSSALHRIYDTTLDKKAHILGPLVPYKRPTCTEEGILAHYTCQLCDTHFADEDAKHILKNIIIPVGTHTYNDHWDHNENNHYHECIYCHEDFDTDPHNWGEAVIVVNPTHTSKGIREYTCTICNYTITEDIPEGDHDPIFIERVEPTCTERGYDLNRCNACGTEVKTNYTDALGHEATLVEKVEADCTNDGKISHYHCSRCNLNFSNKEATKPLLDEDLIIPALGHSFKEALSHDSDHHWYDCIRCDAKKDVTEHTYDQENIDRFYIEHDASCTESASYFYSCICSEKGTETFDYGEPLGHTLLEEHHHKETNSTCQEHGHIEYWYCPVCNENIDANKNVIDKGKELKELEEHTYHGYQVNSTHHWQLCSVCQENSEKVKHTETLDSDDTHHWYKCSVCDYKTSEKEEHNLVYGNGIWYCTKCGRQVNEEPTQPSGFDVDISIPLPTGEITSQYDKDNDTWTFTLNQTGDTTNKITTYSWQVDGKTQIGETQSIFVFKPPLSESYSIMCIFSSKGGYNSASVDI